MPIYEYQCHNCGHELEKLQRMSETPLQDCPECKEPGLRRLVSAAGFRLKGGGWYETDFKQGEQRNLADSARDNGAGKKPASDKADSGKGAGKGKESKTGSVSTAD